MFAHIATRCICVDFLILHFPFPSLFLAVVHHETLNLQISRDLDELLDLLLGHVGDAGVEKAEDGSHEDARHAPEIHHGAGRVLHTGQREHGQEPGAADSDTGLVG